MRVNKIKTLASLEAQSHFDESLDTAGREPVTIMCSTGRAVAFVISPQEGEYLLETRFRSDQGV
jgi:hypothetical protein